MASILFLGTGGGRYSIISQRRYSGGMWIDCGPKIVVDPGPGSLIRALQFGKEPTKLDAVFVSHNHIDHYNDAELMVEAMTGGMKKRRGVLVLNKRAAGYVSDYHKGLVDVIVPDAGETFDIAGVGVQALPTENHDEGIGFRFATNLGALTYSSDTAYSERLISYYKDSRLLVLNTMFPASKEMAVHLNTKSAAKVIEEAAPELAVLQHFGITMLNANPEKEAEWVQKKTGVPTIAARDGMTIELADLSVRGPGGEKEERQLKLGTF